MRGKHILRIDTTHCRWHARMSHVIIGHVDVPQVLWMTLGGIVIGRQGYVLPMTIVLTINAKIHGGKRYI
jgi:hypothetical protein